MLAVYALAGFGLSKFYPKGGHSFWGFLLVLPAAFALYLLNFPIWPDLLLMCGLGSSLFSTTWAIADLSKGADYVQVRREGVPEFVAHLEKPAFRVVLGLLGVIGFSGVIAILI